MENKTKTQKINDVMHEISGVLMVLGQTFISAFFVIVILFLVLFVEIQRVAHGIQLFESSTSLAYLGAFTLVMMLLTLEFVVHYVETKYGYERPAKKDFSLRLVGRWLAYSLGFSASSGANWQERLKSPAHDIKSYSNLLTGTILVLALGGSMSSTIAQIDGAWHQGLYSLLVDSSLIQLTEWASSLLVAFALVLGAQRLTAYVAQRASEVLLSHQNDLVIQNDANKFKNDSVELPIIFDELDTEEYQAVNNDEIIPNSYTVDCECGKSFEHETLDKAQRALRTHQTRFCELNKESGVE